MHPAVLALALCAAVFAQASDSRPVSDPKALDLFKKALAAQTAGGPPLAIVDFQAELEVSVHETDPKTKERRVNSATVIEYYRELSKTEALFRRHLTDPQGSTTIQAYDGRSYWQKLGNAPARDVSRGRESKDDRDRIKSELARTREYVRLLQLSNYDGPDVTFRWVGPTKVPGPEKDATGANKDRDADKIVRERPGEQPIQLMFGQSGGRPVLYAFERKSASGKVELIAFAFHTPLKAQNATILVPLVADYYEDNVLTFHAGANADKIRINTRLEDVLFTNPDAR